MSLKSFVGKMFGKKDPGDETRDEVRHEVSFKDTSIEPISVPDAVGEIDIFVKGEKTNIYEIAGETRIGRDPSQCEIAIPELIVSKRHCSIYPEDGIVYIKDYESTNCTYVNGEKIVGAKLNHNDEITLGKKGTVRIVYRQKGA